MNLRERVKIIIAVNLEQAQVTTEGKKYCRCYIRAVQSSAG